MPLDPQAKAIIDLVVAAGFGDLGPGTDPVAMRALMNEAAMVSDIEIADVSELAIPGPADAIAARLYRPMGDAPLPVIVYFHGGGWVLGSLATHDGICRGLAAGVGAVVVSVDYRLAPEHCYPAAVEDSLAAVRWVAANAGSIGADPDRLVVAGDSAGGNIAAIVAQQARSSGPAIAFQLLVYPATDHEFTSVSMEDNAVGYYLTRASMRWFYDLYLTDPAEGADPAVSPIRNPDLAGLPPAYVVTAEYDPLRDQGLAYVAAMRAAGNVVADHTYAGLFHGFFSMGSMIDAAQVAFDDAVAAVRSAVA
ncbi:MAG: alpha/beta hydrolase [Acidimicrobiia bacterium]